MSQDNQRSSTAKAQPNPTSPSQLPATFADSLRPGIKAMSANPVIQIPMGIALLAALSQISLPLGFTPVPIALGSLAALLVGVFFGPVRGALSAAGFAGLAAGGVPILAGATSGWRIASFGYVLGYIAAAILAGLTMNWIKAHRTTLTARPVTTLTVIAVGLIMATVAIHVPGVIWLATFANISLGKAIALGSIPFWFGDLAKIVFTLGLISMTTVRARRNS